jgi:hypothetical protein
MAQQDDNFDGSIQIQGAVGGESSAVLDGNSCIARNLFTLKK